MGNDARNFFVNAAIVGGEVGQERLRLWLWDEEDRSNAEAFHLAEVGGLPILQDASIEHKEGGIYSITATLVPTFDQVIPLLESSILEQGNWLELEWGYLTDEGEIKSPLYKGQMTLPEIQLGGETSITLKTKAIYGLSATRQTSSREPFNDMTRMDIIKAVLSGGDPKRDYLFHTLVSGDSHKKLLEDKVNAVQGGLSDWGFARRLALECSAEIIQMPYPEGSGKEVVQIRGYEDTASAKPTRLFRLVPHGGTYLPTVGGVYPAFTVSSSSMYVFMPGALIRGVTSPSVKEDEFLAGIDKIEFNEQEEPDLSGYSDVDRDIVKGQLGPKATKHKKGGGAPKKSPLTPGRKDGAGGKITSRDMNDGRNKDKAEGKMVEQSYQNTINLTIESLGVPDMLVGEIVGFEGAGVRFDGNYKVLRFTHGISSSGPTTTAEVIRNASFASEDLVDTKPVNVQDMDPSEAQSEVAERVGT